MNRWPIFLLLMAASFHSCADLKKDEQLKRIHQLEIRLQSVEEKTLANQIDSLTKMEMASAKVEKSLKKHLGSDTIDLILAKKIDAYKIMRQQLKPLDKQYKLLLQSTKEEKRTLKNLSIDIENGTGERQSYESYILFEKNKIKQIEVLFTEYQRFKQEALTNYERLHPELNQYTLEIANKK